MSLRAEMVRLGLRTVFKATGDKEPDLAKIRRGIGRLSWWVRNPPRTTKAVRVMAGGVPAIQVATPRSRHDRHILYLHGGGFVYGTPSLYRDLIWRVADAAGAVVLVVDYRLAPEHPFPAAMEDAVAAYRWLLAEGADPGGIAIMGDSAGGGLTYSTLLTLRDARDPLPAAAVALSPWADLTLTSASIQRFAKADPMLSIGEARFFAAWYLGGTDPKHPYASPVFGDPAGLPPSLIHVGDDEALLDDAGNMADRLRAAGCTVELEIWPRMPHVWHMFARILPEARDAIERIGIFLQSAWVQGPRSTT
jgi:monoterpene epsilon-lactone hydrolase